MYRGLRVYAEAANKKYGSGAFYIVKNHLCKKIKEKQLE
jgi:hypothetical protein